MGITVGQQRHYGYSLPKRKTAFCHIDSFPLVRDKFFYFITGIIKSDHDLKGKWKHCLWQLRCVNLLLILNRLFNRQYYLCVIFFFYLKQIKLLLARYGNSNGIWSNCNYRMFTDLFQNIYLFYEIRKINIPVFSKASALDVFSLSDNFIFSLVGLLFCFSTIKRKKYFIWLT